MKQRFFPLTVCRPPAQKRTGRTAGEEIPDRPAALRHPYEEKEAEADPEAGPTEKPPKSRLPQEDERPADEYDQPWEWKKNHISRAFAGELGRKPQLHLMGSAKFGRPQSPKSSVPLAERIDPSLPLESQAWFHGPISRAEAEALLTLCREGSYLVRSSEASRGEYSLSLRSSQSFMHMKFTRTKDQRYILGQNSAPFKSIPEVVHHYTTQELPVKGAEHLFLLYPVAVQTA
uniref:SH2 domain-containing adapter protein D n=1 Tax=Naja naja TaxID=35670 RepID=A0A8C6VBM7_NAJNA